VYFSCEGFTAAGKNDFLGEEDFGKIISYYL